MSGTPGLFALQQGLLSFLSARSSIIAVIGNPARIYDVPPPQPTFPFILIGDMSSTPWNTRDTTGQIVDLTIKAYSNTNRGSADVKKIGDALVAALHRAAPALSAGTIVNCVASGHSEQEMGDGVTWEGTTRVTIYLQTT